MLLAALSVQSGQEASYNVSIGLKVVRVVFRDVAGRVAAVPLHGKRAVNVEALLTVLERPLTTKYTTCYSL